MTVNTPADALGVPDDALRRLAQMRPGQPTSLFTSDLSVNDFRLPLDQSRYVFHPSLAHAVRLEPVGEPVKSWC